MTTYRFTRKNVSDERLKNHDIYMKYNKLREREKQFNKISLPLCASENIISPFTLLPLQDFTHEKYLLGKTANFSEEGNFVGAEILYEIYNLLNQQAKKLFHCSYADARTLSGLNCITSVLMALTDVGDKIMLASVESGGHSSIPKIAKRLGLDIIYAPYDFKQYDYNYDHMNSIIKEKGIKFILLSPSNIIYDPNLLKLNLDNSILLFDASQTLGLIASGLMSNPLEVSNNIILLGSTHKTIPGPTSGLILTNNENISRLLDSKINPDYVSNTQLVNKLVLLHSLIELELTGLAYTKRLRSNVLYLSNLLKKSDRYTLIYDGKKFSQTHQILLGIDDETFQYIETNALKYNITLTLSKKRNPLFQEKCGLRLGLQEISRYNWAENEMDIVYDILEKISNNSISRDDELVLQRLSQKKEIHFSLYS